MRVHLYPLIPISLAMMFQANSALAQNCSSMLQNKIGDTISVTATLTTGDPNENGEGEPLYVYSSGGEINATIGAYYVATPFSYNATGANETISGTIQSFDGDETCSIVAAVNPSQPFTPDQKKQAGDLTGELAVGGTLVVVGGTVLCTVLSGGMCGAVVAIVGGGLAGFGGVSDQISRDPSDPNYTVIAMPSIASMPPVLPDASITQAEADAFNALSANQAAIIGIGNAAYISGNRAQGAHDAGDSTWEAKQIQVTQLYALQLGGLFTKQVTMLGGLHDALVAAGFSIYASPSDVLNFEYRVAYQGLPASVVNALNTYGVTTDEVNEVKNLFIVQDIYATAGNFPDVLVSPGLIASLQAAAKAFTGTVHVSLDIKPEGSTNAINPRSKGVIPVAVLGTNTFDVTTVDAASTKFGPSAAVPATLPTVEDVNGDGIPDLVLHFKTQDTGLKCGDTMAVLTGKTKSGDMISGADSIQTVGCK